MTRAGCCSQRVAVVGPNLTDQTRGEFHVAPCVTLPIRVS